MKLHSMLCWAGAFATLGALTAAWVEGPAPAAANIKGAAVQPAQAGKRKGNGPDKAAGAPDAARDKVASAGSPRDRASLDSKLDNADRLVGDASFRGALDIGKATRRGERYEIELDGGRRAVLTLRPELQEAAESVLIRAKAPVGAVVVMDKEGRILALAGRKDAKSVPELATQVWAPAASIFKIVTAAALVEAGVRPETRVCYHDGFRSVEASNLRDDPRRDRSCNDLTYGLAESQNAVMAKLAHRHLKPRALTQAANAFGFGEMPAFALPAEPNRVEIPKQPLEFARVAAGFWQTELSPVGGALVAGIVASGGYRITPRLVEHVVDGKAVIPVHSRAPERAIAPEVARAVARMMLATTESGTAYKGFHDAQGRKFLPGIPVAGKTGTLTRRSPSYLEYSWFVGFAPSDSPEIIISVLLGNPERWHLKAHTAARIVLEKAF